MRAQRAYLLIPRGKSFLPHARTPGVLKIDAGVCCSYFVNNSSFKYCGCKTVVRLMRE